MLFFAFLALSGLKQLKLCLFCTTFGTQHYLVYIIVLKWLDFKILVICQKLRVKQRFYVLLSFFSTFAHKVAQSWFVLHETWHTTLFGVYYCVEVVIIENLSHMLEITCLVAILCILMLFWHFRALSSSNLVCFARNLAHNSILYSLLCLSGSN